MSRSLVTAEKITPPRELETFFDDPPLVGNERREDFEHLFLTIAAAVKPADAIEWMLTRDVLMYSWEIRRERRIKADIIELKRKEALRESRVDQGRLYARASNSQGRSGELEHVQEEGAEARG